MIETVAPFFRSGMESDDVITTTSGSVNIKSIFGNEFEMRDLIGVDVESANPLALIPTDDLPADWKQNDIYTHDSKDYYIDSVQPDGTGLSVLILIVK